MWTCSSCRRRCRLHAASALAPAVSSLQFSTLSVVQKWPEQEAGSDGTEPAC
jgi:hypothetical protein